MATATPTPTPLTHNPLTRIGADAVQELRLRRALPPGDTGLSITRTRRFMDDPLSLLLPAYERYGEIFSLRVFHERIVFLLGPAANHFVLVSGAANFTWRESDYGQLVPLIGDGLLTTDGAYHDEARRLLLPAFHHEAVAGAGQTIEAEAVRALEAIPPSRQLDLYAWARRLAMRIAMRALLGLDPDQAGNGARAAGLFEAALAYYGTGPLTRSRRGPGSAWRAMLRARAELDQILAAELARRRARPGSVPGDVLGLLLAAAQDGQRMSDQEIRHQLMTLAFAGHDTATSTITFLIYELARHPAALDRVTGELDAGPKSASEPRHASAPSELDLALDETLRLYPPAWIGPRRVTREFEFAGRTVPAGAYAAYSSWASHHLPDVFPEPEEFRPERFTPAARAALPKAAYVPFGGGSRTCIGMRFGLSEVRTVAALLLSRFQPELPRDHVLRIRQMPTLGPVDGLPVVLHPR